MTESQFIGEMESLGINLTETQINQFNKYYEFLINVNKIINLTTIIEKEDVYLKHFFDCATLVKAVDFNDVNNFCDMGTGAGFPGVVIKILYPHLKVTLIDSLKKRINFLRELVKELDLQNVEIVHSRIEDYSKINREVFDIVSCRALAQLNILLEYGIPMVKVKGFFISMKGNISQEIFLAQKALKILNCQIIKTIKFALQYENGIRNLIIIKKMNITSKKYPRKLKQIKNEPL